MTEAVELISAAKGETPADLLLKNARVVDTLAGGARQGNVAIYGGRIAGVGDYRRGKKSIDLRGAYLAPGLINGHTHIESSMLHPVQYAQAVVPRGTLALVTDLHEIANVCGFAGIEFVRAWAEKLPLDILLMAPSCVPASALETSGARLGVAEVKRLLSYPDVIGLGEVMNFPGVLGGDKEVLSKISAAEGRAIDGHAPGLLGKELSAYAAAGIRSDHESTTLEEGRERLEKGMYLMIREGSSEKNLDTLLPLVTDKSHKRCLFVVDDRSCSDLLHEGDIDSVVRKAISRGLEPTRALQLATINAAEHFRLYDRGAIAPGYLANLITVTDLSKLEIDMVFYKGELVATQGKPIFPSPSITPELTDTMHIKHPAMESLKLTPLGETFPVIEIVPGQIVTRKRIEEVNLVDGAVVPDLDRDILKLVVVERHHATGNIGLGLVKGFGLKQGALASSVAHDSHNVVAVGTTDLDILKAIEEVARLRGGLVACARGEIIGRLPLPVAGLLSLEPLKLVVDHHDALERTAAKLGNLPPAPFSLLSFLALPVIPELRLTDLGLVDVATFQVIN